MNWQFIIAIVLLALAVVYVARSVVRSFQARHDCPDCDMPVPRKKSKKDKRSIFKQVS